MVDKYLASKGQKFVRYADDFSIYAKGKSRAEEIRNQVVKFLKDKLKLLINAEKSGISRPSSFQILGYGFTSIFEKEAKGGFKFIVLEKSLNKL